MQVLVFGYPFPIVFRGKKRKFTMSPMIRHFDVRASALLQNYQKSDHPMSVTVNQSLSNLLRCDKENQENCITGMVISLIGRCQFSMTLPYFFQVPKNTKFQNGANGHFQVCHAKFQGTHQWMSGKLLAMYVSQVILTYAYIGFGHPPQFLQKWQCWTKFLTRFSVDGLLFHNWKEYVKTKQ